MPRRRVWRPTATWRGGCRACRADPAKELAGALSTLLHYGGIDASFEASASRQPIKKPATERRSCCCTAARPIIAMFGGLATRNDEPFHVIATTSAIPVPRASAAPYSLADLADDADALIGGLGHDPLPCDGDLAGWPDRAGAGGAAIRIASTG